MKTIKLTGLALSVVLLITSCTKPLQNATKNSNVVSGSFINIYNSGNGTITLTPGTANQVTSSTNNNYAVVGNRLVISGNGNINVTVNALDTILSSGNGVIATSSALNLKSLCLGLSGNDSINLALNLRDSLTVAASGNGKYYLSGSSPKLILAESGNANFFGYNLITQNCTIAESGNGNTQVYVTGTLNVFMSGNGTVYYKGKPTKVNPVISGGGQVIPQ